jgi:hypothetical protein
MADLDAARGSRSPSGNLLERGLVVHLVGRGIERRPLVHDRLQVGV